jgi:hypothetical protein
MELKAYCQLFNDILKPQLRVETDRSGNAFPRRSVVGVRKQSPIALVTKRLL